MIKKRNASLGLNTNVNIDPSASSNASANASPNISNHIYIRDFRKDEVIIFIFVIFVKMIKYQIK